MSPDKPDRIDVDPQQVKQIYDSYNVDPNELETAVADRLADRGWNSYEPTAEFAAAIRRSFADGFLKCSNGNVIPEAVDVASRDAGHWVRHRYQQPGANLTNDVIPLYVSPVATTIPAYSQRGLHPRGSIEFHYPGDGSQPNA